MAVVNRLSTQTATSFPWLAIGVAWLVAGSVTAVLFHYQLFILQLLGRLVGVGTVTGGVIVVMGGSLLSIVAFVLLIQQTPLGQFVTSGVWVVFTALVYASVLYLVVFGVGIPLATQFHPVPSMPIPYLPLDGYVILMLFGLLVGVSLGLFWSPSDGRT